MRCAVAAYTYSAENVENENSSILGSQITPRTLSFDVCLSQPKCTGTARFFLRRTSGELDTQFRISKFAFRWTNLTFGLGKPLLLGHWIAVREPWIVYLPQQPGLVAIADTFGSSFQYFPGTTFLFRFLRYHHHRLLQRVVAFEKLLQVIIGDLLMVAEVVAGRHISNKQVCFDFIFDSVNVRPEA